MLQSSKIRGRAIGYFSWVPIGKVRERTVQFSATDGTDTAQITVTIKITR
ncbi:MAG: hypothetical protein HY584_01965 [Candidatus Omnitrophica bacterium]|nr:hypothetical protein [Candidatus Omnitrophota bacterium]